MEKTSFTKKVRALTPIIALGSSVVLGLAGVYRSELFEQQGYNTFIVSLVTIAGTSANTSRDND